MKQHSALYQWFWYRPLFRRLRPRLMTMMLALVLPVSLVCLALSVVSIYQSRASTYEMNQNALSFYLDEIALREELGDIDIVSDFPSSLAPRLTLLYWNAGANDSRAFNGGSVYVAMQDETAYKILPDGTWEPMDRSFSELKQTKHFSSGKRISSTFGCWSPSLMIFPCEISPLGSGSHS